MKNVWSAGLVSVLVVGSFGLVIAQLLWRPVDLGPQVTTILNVLLGVLAAKFGTVVDYWLGSSVGTSKDNALVGRIEDRPPL